MKKSPVKIIIGLILILSMIPAKYFIEYILIERKYNNIKIDAIEIATKSPYYVVNKGVSYTNYSDDYYCDNILSIKYNGSILYDSEGNIIKIQMSNGELFLTGAGLDYDVISSSKTAPNDCQF